VAQLNGNNNSEKRDLFLRGQSMKQAILLLKQEIPSEYRIDAEEAGFDFGLDQRRINFHLRAMTEESEPDFYPQFYQFEPIEEDIKPFIVETFKYVLCAPPHEERS